MPEIRCPNCGKSNPDFFDACQFCQSPLEKNKIRIGDSPEKMDTGELEGILPEWLKDARQQNRDSGKDQTVQASVTTPQFRKNEPPDLLAGLMSQADDDDDDVPDWLAGMNPVKDVPSTSKLTSTKKEEEQPSDFFAQFSQPSNEVPASAPSNEEPASWMMGGEQAAEDEDATPWLSKPVSDEPEVSFNFDSTPTENETMFSGLGSFDEPQQSSASSSPEDLSWLHDLESSSKGDAGQSSDSSFDFSQPSESQEDLGWLNNLGGESAPAESGSSQQEDMSWLNNLGGETVPSQQSESTQEDLGWMKNLGDEFASSEPAAQQEDMSWLSNLGGETAPSQQPESTQEDLGWMKNLGDEFISSEPAPSSTQDDTDWMKSLGAESEPVQAAPTPAQDDTDWMKNLGSEFAPSEPVPSSAQDDTDWMKNFGAESEPAQTAPTSAQDDTDWMSNLGGEAAQEQTESPQGDLDWLNNFSGPQIPAEEEAPTSVAPFDFLPQTGSLSQEGTPDWLQSAMEEPSMPAPGAVSMEWFNEHDKSAKQEEEPAASDFGEPAPTTSGFDFSSSDFSSSQDVDSLFDIDMPDIMPSADEAQAGDQGAVGENLAPVELPSWVQAMRPVESALASTTVDVSEEAIEQEGPLAGFQGVIPAAPIGSSLRPKAVSLKLQVTEDQEAAASILEQIIAGEATANPYKAKSHITPQQTLRWVLSSVFIVVLSLVMTLGLKTMPIYASGTVNEFSSLVASIPDSAPVLVVVDYDPALAGELEVVAGPVLDQLALSRHSAFTFVAMSPNGSALVERLMSNTGLKSGLGYQAGTQYFNMGFLPGGSSGVDGFIRSAKSVKPTIAVENFSNFAAVIVMTDTAETGRVWVEQVQIAKGKQPELNSQPLLLLTSAQAGPILQPYVSSGQVDIMLSGLEDAAGYEFVNNTRPGTARIYWDAYGIGMLIAILSIVIGSLWNVAARLRKSQEETE